MKIGTYFAPPWVKPSHVTRPRARAQSRLMGVRACIQAPAGRRINVQTTTCISIFTSSTGLFCKAYNLMGIDNSVRNGLTVSSGPRLHRRGLERNMHQKHQLPYSAIIYLDNISRTTAHRQNSGSLYETTSTADF